MDAPRARIVLAINPTASFGRTASAGSVVARMLEDLGHEVEALSAPHLDELRHRCADALKTSPDAVVVVGGDGMVHLGVNLLVGTSIPLGIIPSGTGNDMARGLDIPLDLEAAVRALDAAIGAGARWIDAGRIVQDGSETWFACVLSAGFDAIVNERANRMRRPRGASRYTIAILRELVALTPRRYRLVVDGVAREEEAMLVSVANNRSMGGGMRITPDALVDDGMLDLFLVRPLGRLAFLRVFPKVFAGAHTHHPKVSIERVRRVEIDSPGIVAYADGERIGPLPLAVEVVPRAFRLLA